MTEPSERAHQRFRLEEATIAEMQAAIVSGETTCVDIVRHYIERARAYNGPASLLVTADGAPIEPATGTVRAGKPLSFPTETVPVASIYPDLDKYQGKPLELGRMEATRSDPAVQQQYGMVVGIPEGTQLNALSTLNIRGERSVVCRGDYDRHPDDGPLPEGAPAVCEIFRRYPDALERAAELDAAYGRNPDLAAMPMYGVVFSFKDPFDCKDMRSLGGGDAAYDIDFPARDHILVDQLRNKGAIIYAKAVSTEYNGRAGDPGGADLPDRILPSTLGYQRSTWGGNPSNPYDTTRSASLGSSSGSALSVSTNLVMASLGEETRASCRGPANHNSVALILPHKAMLGFNGGAIGADIYTDRTGVICRSVFDCAKVVDALRDRDNGYYDPRDVFTTVPRSSILSTPFVSHLAASSDKGALAGMRIGVIRESMITPPGSLAEGPIVSAADREIRDVLGAHLGATLVESVDPLWNSDSSLEKMAPSFRDAVARLVPIFMPDILFRLGPDGLPVYREVAEAIIPTPFVPCAMPSLASPTVAAGAEMSVIPPKVFGSGAMKPIDYCVALAEGRIAPPRNLDIHTIQEQELATTFRLHIQQYLMRRAADWQSLGMTETLTSFAELNARSKFWGDDQRAAFLNWDALSDPRNPLDGRQGVNERVMLRELLRRVDMMVLYENKLDAFVRLHSPWVPGKIGHANQPRGGMHNITWESFYGPNAGLTEILVPAGFVDVCYDPVFTLSDDRKRYVPTASSEPTPLPAPGLPFSLVFRSEPGKEDVIVRIASAYERASRRRVPPPAFGPLQGLV
ncbi:amidase family protein [Bradyrhizobium sp.]|uniref:amidase family protein n=1 Tax=Bradyrhizobium sp. TaxID=376 RepID=UPI003C40B495